MSRVPERRRSLFETISVRPPGGGIVSVEAEVVVVAAVPDGVVDQLAHDIGVAVEVADRIAVMYAGRIVEIGPVRDVIRAPRHPYTIGLLSTRAHGGRLSGNRLPAIAGSPPDLANLPPGCAFAPRCTLAADICRPAQPDPVALGPAHAARCFRTDATLVRAQAIPA